MSKNERVCAYIDASNLFYGGEKSLGWKIDYAKFLEYLKNKYGVTDVYYFGGVEIHTFPYDYLTNDTVPLSALKNHIDAHIRANKDKLNEADLVLYSRHLDRISFYTKLEEFGYTLFLKPVKMYTQEDGTTKRKANCDVDMAYYMMKDKDMFDNVIFLSGDGDFLPVLKHLKSVGKNIVVLGRGRRTAKEIKKFAGQNFRDFEYLRELIKRKDPDNN